MNPTNPNAVVGSGAVGAALGVLLVMFLPQFTSVTFTANEAAMATAAFGTVFAWGIRFIPRK